MTAQSRIPASWKGADWQRLVANAVNPLLDEGLPDRVAAIEAAYIPSSQKGAANGVASLDSGGKVPTSQLPATGEWTQIATSTPTGTGTVTFASIPTTYSDLLLVVNGISHDAGSSQFFQVALSPDGTSFSTALAIGLSAAGANFWYGALPIPGYRKDAGACQAAMMVTATASPVTSQVNNNFGWRCTGGISAIRLTFASGNFDAGTLTLYGR